MVRQIPVLPLGTPRVHYLRTEAHADALAAELRAARHLVVVGGGLIGLEVAASAASSASTSPSSRWRRASSRGCATRRPRRVIEAEHRRHGVDIRLGAALTAAEAHSDGRLALKIERRTRSSAPTSSWSAPARSPDDRLAAEAGLRTDNGIVVDDAVPHLRSRRSSRPGDVVRFPGPHGLVRQEDWRHAQDQGSVAGRNAAGASETYRSTPSFWSEQFGLYIQGVGWPSPEPGPAGAAAGRGTTITFELTDAHLRYALGINAQRDMAVVRRLIERRIAVDPAALADPTKALADLLKAKP